MNGGCSPAPIRSSLSPVLYSNISCCSLSPLSRQAGYLRPALNEAVVGKCFGGALLALAECVKTVAELAGNLGLAAKLGCQFRGRTLAACPVWPKNSNELTSHSLQLPAFTPKFPFPIF